jgi:hypothetical protein
MIIVFTAIECSTFVQILVEEDFYRLSPPFLAHHRAQLPNLGVLDMQMIIFLPLKILPGLTKTVYFAGHLLNVEYMSAQSL